MTDVTARPRVVLAGRTSLLRSCITTILQTRTSEIALVLIRRNASELDNSLLQYCKRSAVPVLLHESLSSAAVITAMQRIRPALLLSMYNAEVFGASLLETAGLAVNFHESPLPRYAGLNPAAWALLNDEPRHGVTWHLITSRIDAGPIVIQEMFDLQHGWDVLDLLSVCMRHGGDLFRRMLPTLLDGSFNLQPQDLSQRTYFSQASKPFGGTVSLSSGTQQLARLSRATAYFPMRNDFARPFMPVDGKMIELLRFRVLPHDGDRLPGCFIGVEESAAAFALPNGKLLVDLARTVEDADITGATLASRYHFSCRSAAGDITLS
jgi:methionyl-tRNA formyltransferase